MAKIVFIGAGSLGFTRDLVRDCLTFPSMRDAHFALVDTHPGRLEMSRQACQKLIDTGKVPARITTTTDRRKALKDADAVMVTILAGGVDVWQYDITIPKQYGVDINVGDTRGPAGIFRALRTIPEMLAICRDVECYCPGAVVLNYTNPMAMRCQAMQKTTKANVTGLCHSVQGTAEMLAKWAGVPHEEVDYICAGINHLAWYTSFTHKGRDLYPVLRQKISKDRAIYNAEQVRNEMFLAFDYYVTESSGHNSEYNWWFRKRPDLIQKYCTSGTNWNPGAHAYILNEYRARLDDWEQRFQKWLTDPSWKNPTELSKKLQRGHEYASYITNAWLGYEPFRFNGNVLNTGRMITNLPQDCCVEVPVLASRGCLQAIHVGDLPQQVVPLTSLNATCEVMAVEAALTGNPRLVYQAIASDPLTAAMLSLAEIKEMVNAMLTQNKPYLPQFKHFKA